MLGDIQMSKKVYLSHWLARGSCLLVMPISIYLASFAAHFHILSNSGPGDANMGSLFQARLNGSVFKDNPLGKPLLNLIFLFVYLISFCF